MSVGEKVQEAIREGSQQSHLDFALHVSLQDVESQLLTGSGGDRTRSDILQDVHALYETRDERL